MTDEPMFPKELQPYQRDALEWLGVDLASGADLVGVRLAARRYGRSLAMDIFETELERQGWTAFRRSGFTRWTRTAPAAQSTETL